MMNEGTYRNGKDGHGLAKIVQVCHVCGKTLLLWLQSFILFSLPCSSLRAQELEYAVELGGMAGGSFYLGDANYTTLYKGLNLGAGVMGRYNINPRMSLKGNIAYGGISGNALLQDNKYPANPDQKWKFNKGVWDVGCQYEISFWGYGMGTGYKGQRRLVPYIQVGLGATVCGSVFTANIPFGFGVKYKFKERWNCGIDWTMRFSLSDELDRIPDPYSIKGGFLKNKDSYCFTMFYISYDLCPKYRKCNND